MEQEHVEMKSKRLCKVERSSSDIISTLPPTIIETILCLLTTKEAAMTSILSREWRYKWTKIPKLEFSLPLVSERITKEKQVHGKYMDTKCKPFYDLHQILLLHKGPINEFSLFIDLSKVDEDSFGFDQIVLHLSKNHPVKKLKLLGLYGYSWHNLPVSLFSLHHLTDLDLACFNLDHQPIFNGFGSLRRLSLNDVRISTKSLLHLLSSCPSLKSLTMISWFHFRFGEYSDVWEEYSNVWLEHLSELKIKCFRNLKHEMKFVKFILARSPKLKKVSITANCDRNQEPKMLKTLLNAPRVSPVIITYKHLKDSFFKDC